MNDENPQPLTKEFIRAACAKIVTGHDPEDVAAMLWGVMLGNLNVLRGKIKRLERRQKRLEDGINRYLSRKAELDRCSAGKHSMEADNFLDFGRDKEENLQRLVDVLEEETNGYRPPFAADDF